MTKACACVAVFLLSAGCLRAQCLTAFKDTRPDSERLYAIDNGRIIQLEYKALSFRVGRTMIAYVNNAYEFKVYFNGETQVVLKSVPVNFSYFVTDSFVFYSDKIYDGYKSYERCFVDRDEALFSPQDTFYYMQRRKDYLSRFCFDDISGIFDKLYLDTVYVPYAQDGYFYLAQGRTFVEIERIPESLQTNRRIAAFVDFEDGRFKVFYNGQIFPVEEFAPVEYHTGEDFIAYLSSTDDSFKVFYDGKIYPLTDQLPKSFSITKDLLIYFDWSDHFYAFYRGKNVKLTSYRPEEIRTDRGILVFKDLNKRLQGFIDGKVQPVSTQAVSDFFVKNKTVVYYTIPNSVQVFCDGKTIRAY